MTRRQARIAACQRYIAEEFQKTGLLAEEYCVRGSTIPTDLTRAHRFRGFGAELAFKTLSEDLILIIYYGRERQRHSLGNAFQLLQRFLDQISGMTTSVRAVTTVIDTTPFRNGNDLTDQRLAVFCQRHLGARVIDPHYRPEISCAERTLAVIHKRTWLFLDLEGYRIRQYRKV